MFIKMVDSFAFVLFVISVGAMDSECVVIPAACCVGSAAYFLYRSNKQGGVTDGRGKENHYSG